MSQYLILKDAIDAAIYENSQQAITGSTLNTVLNSMVTTLGENYQFGGLVSPTDTYTVSDSKVVFLASEEGNYPAFGNFSVGSEEIALFYWDTHWYKKTIPTAMGLKADLVEGKVPSSQLPSFVDDVIEVDNYAALPVTGETGKIYVTKDTNTSYRWTGTAYVKIGNPLDYATQAEAEGNAENTKVMTALRVFQSFMQNVGITSIAALNTSVKNIIGAINELYANKFDKTSVVQTNGSSTTNVMSQDGVTQFVYSNLLSLPLVGKAETTIAQYKAVMSSLTQGNSDTPFIKTFDGTASGAYPVAVTNASVTPNEISYTKIIRFGYIKNIPISAGSMAENWTNNQVIYIQNDGSLGTSETEYIVGKFFREQTKGSLFVYIRPNLGYSGKVISQAIAQNSADIKTLFSLVDNGYTNKAHSYDALDLTGGYKVSGFPVVLYGVGVPSATTIPLQVGIPAFIGQMYIDTTPSTGGLYISWAVSAISDWHKV